MRQRTIPELQYTGFWWYSGSEQEWRALPWEERMRLAFNHTGCEIAFPSWRMPVNCLHTACRIARKELPKIAMINSQLRGERVNGWLRFTSDRRKVAAIYRACRKSARQTGVYDIWKNWQLIVAGGLQ